MMHMSGTEFACRLGKCAQSAGSVGNTRGVHAAIVLHAYSEGRREQGEHVYGGTVATGRSPNAQCSGKKERNNEIGECS